MLPLDNLRCFAEAARLLNFRAAARVVGLTPAALGNRIATLEAYLGEPLFHRTTRKVMLTEAGLRLVPYAERVLESARDCERAARGDIGPAPIELTVGTRQELGLSWLLPMRRELERAVPGLTLHYYFGSGADLLLRTRTLEIDFAIGSMRMADPKLDAITLHREDYVLVAAPRLLKRHPLRTMADAKHHALVDVHADLPLYAYLRDELRESERMRFSRILRMGTIEAIRQTVVAGDGVAVLPAYVVADDLKANRLIRVLSKHTPQHDFFRLVFRADDPRRSIYEKIAAYMRGVPLR